MAFFYSFRYALETGESFLKNKKTLLKNKMISKKIEESFPGLSKE